MSTAVGIIKAELNQLRARKMRRGSDIVICCPFHDEKTPSCGINLSVANNVPVGFFHCFGCNESGPWNKLAERMGLQQLDDDDFRDNETYSPDDGRAKRMLGGVSLSMPKAGIMYNKAEWRGVDGRLVREVGGVLAWDWYMRETCLYLPVETKGRLRAIIKASLVKRRDVNSYIFNAPMGLNDALFPYDYVDAMLSRGRHRRMFIVEGARDALALMQNDVPALALLGSRQWSENKKRLVTSICEERKVAPVVMLDADAADAQRRIYKDLKGEGGEQVRLDRWECKLGIKDLDPATLPAPMWRKLRKASTM